MNKIIGSFLDTHIREYEIEKYSKESAFEHFINRCIVNKYTNERFDPVEIMTDEGEKGLDGIAIVINETLVFSIEQAEAIIKDNSNLRVTFVFIQSKTSENFSASEIGDFIYGVKAFFAASNERPSTNERIESMISIKDYIFENSVNLAYAPTVDMYYACCGQWNDDNGIQPRIDIELQSLRSNTDFYSVNFYKYDHKKIIATYKELKKKVSRSIIMEKRVTFPQIEGVRQAYIGFVRCCDYIKLLSDEDGKLLNNIFEDNVRDFQGYNVVNSEIRETIFSLEDQERFAVLNNGITIVANQIKLTGDKIELFDYQIVNGCQTSYVLFENQHKIIDNSYIVIKIIEVCTSEIADRVIYTTNRQTEVKIEAFVSSTKFQKGLQDFYNAIESEYRLFYERRSRQFDFDDSINKNKVISLTTQIKAYVAMFLNEPHSTHRYYGELLSSYKNKLFLDQDAYEVYYISAYYYYYVDSQFRLQHIDSSLKKYKYHLIYCMRLYLVGSEFKCGQARKQRKLFNTLFQAIQSDDIKQAFDVAILCLKKVLSATNISMNSQCRTKEFTVELCEEIDKVRKARIDTKFLRVNNTVQCTVTGNNKSFVYVELKTTDIRKKGQIHVSNFTNEYVDNLSEYITLGEIFSARIISEYDECYGWKLKREN